MELCLAPYLGGLELYFFWCSQYFHQSAHRLVSVVDPSARLATHFQEAHLPYVPLRRLRWFSVVKQTRQLMHLIKQHRVDIVHVHHKQDLLLVALAKRFSRHPFKLVHTRQMHLPHSKKDPYHRFIYTSLDLLITITDQLKRNVQERVPLPPHKVQRLYYGVAAPADFHPAGCQALPRYAEPSTDLRIGMFSRIEWLKGQHILLEAAALLQARGYSLVYYLFGDVMRDDYRQQLQHIIDHDQLTDCVFFQGFSRQVRTLMPCMDVVVMPSVSETFGLTVIEAMRSGVPVIGSDSGGIPEIIEHRHTGLLFPPQDAAALAECITELIEHPALRTTLAQAGKEAADQRFDEQHHFEGLTRLFYQLTAQPA